MRTEASLLCRRTRRVVAAVSAALVGLTCVAVAGSPAGAAPADPPTVAARAAETREALLALMRSGAGAAQIEQQLGLVRVSADAPASGPLSTSGDIAVYTPTIYYDTGLGAYYVASDWRWNNQSTNAEGAVSGVNVGGLDGFSLRFSQDIVHLGATMSLCPGVWHGTPPYPSLPGCYTAGVWENSEDGVTFKYQDKLHYAYCGGTDFPSCKVYGAARGYSVFTFRRMVGGCLQVFNKVVHTWSFTTITGFTVSNSGWSLSLGSGSSAYQYAAAAPGRLGC